MKKISRRKLERLLGRFEDARILVVGDLMLDRFVWGTVGRISPEAPVPVVEVTSESDVPGGSANVVNNISALGAKAHVCGIIGADRIGMVAAARVTDRRDMVDVDAQAQPPRGGRAQFARLPGFIAGVAASSGGSSSSA